MPTSCQRRVGQYARTISHDSPAPHSYDPTMGRRQRRQPISKNNNDNRRFKIDAKNIVAIASGKGGVGKSTFSVNLATALSSLDLKIGLLDADIYGPSIPRMMGISQKPIMNENKKLIPLENYGIKLMSIGFILDSEAPTIWRGPMVMKALEQMFNGVEWGKLDYLIIDLPPGTGDAQLTLAQSSKLSGSIACVTLLAKSFTLLIRERGSIILYS